jgi:peroxiredoxin
VTKHTTTILGGFGLACLFGVAACSVAPGDEPTADYDSSGDPIVVRLLEAPEPLPDFMMTDLDGQTMSPADWRGKVVLVNFWATWCAPCLVEIPDLISLQDRYRDQLLVIGVSEDHEGVDLQAFADEHQLNYPIVRSTPEVHEAFPGVIALPTTFVIDPEGLMTMKHVGLLYPRETEAMTRVLAGMEIQNVHVERVDDVNRLSAEHAAEITEMPGVDLSNVPAERRGEAILALNEEECTCGCGLSVAKCRIDDPACAVSQPLAQSIADTFAVQ